METIVEYAANAYVFERAAEIISRGGLVVFPTETVYGLGCDGLNPQAARLVYEAKGRPSDNPLILHVLGIEDLKNVVSELSHTAKILIDRFWPGPLTLILPKAEVVPDLITGGLKTVAVRCPSHMAARELIKASKCPIAAPSANTSGKPSPTNAKHVIADMFGRVDMIIDGGDAECGLESTIVDLTSGKPRILRPGSITAEMLAECIELESYTPTQVRAGDTPKAPGMKYRHYAPDAETFVINGALEDITDYIRRETLADPKMTAILATDETIENYREIPARLIMSFGSRKKPETIAHNLFDALRTCDDLGCERIFAEGISEAGLGSAIMNRLTKAGRLIQLGGDYD